MAIGACTRCWKHNVTYVEECYECLREERDKLRNALNAWANNPSHHATPASLRGEQNCPAPLG